MVLTPETTGMGATPWVLYAPADLPHSVDGKVRDLVRRWFDCRLAGLPTRKTLAPETWPQLLGSSYLLDRLACDDYRFRVAGSQFRSLHEGEVIGRKLSEVLPSDSRASGLRGDIAACTGGGWPVFRTGWTTWLHARPPVRFQRVMLPLSASGEGCVAQIFGAVRFYLPQE